jgi:hypothetical protein
MHLVHDKRKAVYLILLVVGSYFVSGALFFNLASLLGAVVLGSILKKERLLLSFVLLSFLALLLLNGQLGFSFNLIYPFAFAGVSVLILNIAKDIKKGELIFYVTIGVVALFIGYMALMEMNFGLLTKTVQLAKEEVGTVGNTLKGIMPENEVKEYTSFSNKLIDDYFIFIALIQYVLFTVANVYLMPKIFTDLPVNLLEEFSQLKIPFIGIWGINAGLAIYIFATGKAATWGINVSLFFLSFYFFQGISLSALFFKRFSIPLYVSILFYIFFLANQIMWLLISLAGVADSQFNLKKYLKEAQI